jgi:prepilin-type processing-associated H-X9-DG protein
MVTITDGTSNTFLAGEARKDLTYLGQFQSDDNEGYSSGWDHDTMRQTTIAPMRDSNNGSGWGEQRFGSSHDTGFNMLFCDGTVRFINYNIDLGSFTALGTTKAGDSYSYQLQ